MSFDFPNARLPSLLPLQASHAENAVEGDIKRLTSDLFDALLAPKVFDVNVSGAAHLGSFDLVRKAVNSDGLVLLQGDREEAATRYLYRAWKSGDVQGRGLHFLKTYLQLLFPNQCEVEQLWQDKACPYPSALYTARPGLVQGITAANHDNRVADTSGMFLTSRVMISLGVDVDTQSVTRLIQIIRDVMPARLLPVLRFWLRIHFDLGMSLVWSLWMRKDMLARYPWCGRVITDEPVRRWKLGIDAMPPRLPQPFGTFKLGHLTGGKSNWRLRSCRVAASVSAAIVGQAPAWRVETLPAQPPLGSPPARARLTVSGRWKLGARRNPAFDWYLIRE